MNANPIFNWQRGPRYVPKPGDAPDAASCPPVGIVDHPVHEDSSADAVPAAVMIEIGTACGHRLHISDACDPKALARLMGCLPG